MNSEQRINSLDIHYNQVLPKQQPLPVVLQYLAIPIAVTGFLVITSINSNSFIQVALAFILLLIPWVSYLNWSNSKAYGIPIFSLIAGLHWLYFAVALFWGDRLAPVWYSNNTFVSEDAVTHTLLMVVLGVCAIGLGIHIKFTKPTVSQQHKPLILTSGMWNYIRGLLVAGLFSSLFNLAYVLGEAGRQWILAFQSTVPLFAFLLLLRRYFRGEAVQADKILITLYIVGRTLTGLGSGWSGSVFYLGVAIALVYLLERRAIPIRAMLLVIVLAVFLQQGKSQFRSAFWYTENNQADLFTRINYWLDESLQSWQEAFNDPSGEQLIDYLRDSMLRVSLLTHAANVHDNTPAIVPYQEWQLYEFSIAGLVPRFFWSDKPSGNDANRFYQVAYGVTQENRLESVSIAIGFMTEAYISFGWFGVFIVMFLLGRFYRGITGIFFRSPNSLLSPSIGILAVILLFRIETQLGLYLVSTVQAIVVACLVLIPITHIKYPR